MKRGINYINLRDYIYGNLRSSHLNLHINLIINYSDCVILTRLSGLSSHVHHICLHMTKIRVIAPPAIFVRIM